MAEVVKMPKLSDTMTEGVIAKWHKKVGDKVKSGELLADIETDKATMEFESFQDGVLLHIGIEEGKPVPVDAVIAVLGEEGEDISDLVKGGGEKPEKSEDKSDKPKKEKKADADNSEESDEDAEEETDSDTKEKNKAAKKDDAGDKDEDAEDEKESGESNAAGSVPEGVEVVRMPKLSDTMTEGVVAKWHKKVGDKVKSGELLADIETDKATMEFESFQDGVLIHIGVEEGKAAAVDSVLAILGKGGEDVDAILKSVNGGGASKKASTEKSEKKESSSDKKSEPTKEKSEGSEKKDASTSSATGEKTENSKSADGRVKASPLAKAMAREKGIDVSAVNGTGDNGRVTKKDIESYTPSQTKATGAVATANVAAGQESYTDQPVSQMRKTIARRLLESTNGAPSFVLNIEVDMDNAMAAREAMNAIPETKISFNDIVIKACAMALRKHPKVNTSWLGDKIRTYSHIHIGMAVAIDDGLVVPVIRFADQKTLSEISANAKDLGKRARDKKLQPSDWEGNTFTVSNLGMFGIESFTSIINSPESCILSVGAIRQVPVVKNGMVVPGNTMMLTLACDHRTVDGATGAAFLQTLKIFMENPVTMLV
ncbi:MAG: pyruvate dehydrogenase complex dihydrolipoamide acetyltransferase [Bacteroidia bacterium]|nr:pyruvate dehydrogenase complex dihydrolipoamide acetyltransferase [Bacteroidia bacterium]